MATASQPFIIIKREKKKNIIKRRCARLDNYYILPMSYEKKFKRNKKRPTPNNNASPIVRRVPREQWIIDLSTVNGQITTEL